MWKSVVKSVRGSAHFTNGLPCQDSSGIESVGDALICALSDGAGSAKYADEGSQLIVAEALDYFRIVLRDNPNIGNLISEFDKSDGILLVERIQKALSDEAIKREVSIHEFAGTLLVAIIHESNSCFYQIGDGAWCVSRSGVLGAATWPTQGEYAGQTAFVTGATYKNDLQFSFVSGLIEYAVGMTDGTERLALDMQSYTPHRRFCDPMIKGLSSSDDHELLRSGLESFLSSDSICERTDDDKSLALIVHAGSL
jgi:hypothetical protein